jgi:PAS domain S-box-containing protein
MYRSENTLGGDGNGNAAASRPPQARSTGMWRQTLNYFTRVSGSKASNFRINRYVIAIALVAAAAFIRVTFLRSLGSSVIFITFYPAVMLAALFGGFRSGILAAVLSAILADYYWIEPEHSFAIDRPADWLATAVFVINCTLLSGVAGRLRQTNEKVRRLEASQRDELERQVAERTSRLREVERDLVRAQAMAQIGSWRIDARTGDASGSDETFRIFGVPPSTPVNYEFFLKAVHPDDRELVDRSWQSAKQFGAQHDLEHRIIANGAVKWVRERAELEYGADGQVLAVFGTCQDITERKGAEEELRITTERFQLALKGSPIVVFCQDLELRYTWIYNPALGYVPPEVIGKLDSDIFERAEDAAVTEAMKRGVIQTGVSDRREVLIHAEGVDRHYDLLVDPLLDGGGKIMGVTCAAIDITEQKNAEKTRQLLVGELNHRVKNILAVVQSIALQSLRSHDVAVEVRQSFASRIEALSAGHELLSRTNWEKSSLGDVVLDAIAFCGPASERVSHHGPLVMLSPKQALAITMALHELSTNALKHGSLSTSSGSVELSWRVGDEGAWLEIEWREKGGPPVRPPERRSFGSMMIEKALPYELGGEATLSFDPEGVVCRIKAPVLAEEPKDDLRPL